MQVSAIILHLMFIDWNGIIPNAKIRDLES